MVKVNKFNSQDKILQHLDKLDYYFNGHKTLVVTELDLTNSCNNNCPHCTGRNENNAQLSWAEIKKIVQGLAELDNKGVIISGGGEPLLHPKFAETVELIRSKGMKIGVNSNGLALDEEMATAVVNNCEYFRVSLDAGSAEMYNQIHGMEENDFKQVIDNIKMLINIRNKMNSETSLGTGFLTSELTKDDMNNFVEISKECGVDFAQFRPFLDDLTDISDEYHKLKEKYETADFKVAWSEHKYEKFNAEDKRPYDKCHGMFFSTVVTADAKLYACIHHRQEEDYLLGDIKKQSLPEIWRSARKWEVFARIDFSDCPYFCRNDAFNRSLNLLDLDVVHTEFL